MMRMLAMTASMLVVGWIVWKTISRREEVDADLQRTLDADERRAAEGRRADAGLPPSVPPATSVESDADRDEAP